MSATFVLIVFLKITSSSEIHDEKYFCGSKDNQSSSRTLILSPNDKYLSSLILQNVTGKVVPKNEDKVYSFPVFLSGFVKDTTECITFLEVPEMFENENVLEISGYLKLKCFDRVLVFIDAKSRKPSEER